MTVPPKQKFIDAINDGVGLRDEFIYYPAFEDYKNFPPPYSLTTFSVEEVRQSIYRYPNPEKQGELFRWDIHGRLLTPRRVSIPGIAVVMIHGGTSNEYSLLFTPDGPEHYLDLTKMSPSDVRVGIGQHVAALGIPVLTISSLGYYSSTPWPPIASRKPEFILGEVPGDGELRNRLAVYTYRLCGEAIKQLIEKNLPNHALYLLGHSTGGEHFYLIEQFGLKNQVVGRLGFASGIPAGIRKAWAEAIGQHAHREMRAKQYAAITDLSRRLPDESLAGPLQPWGNDKRRFELESHRRPHTKPFLSEIEHQGLDTLFDEVRKKSGLPDEELFTPLRADLNRLRGKKMLYFVGDQDQGHWIEGAEKGVEFRREVYGLARFSKYADKVRLVVIPGLSHSGHVELHNDRLANMMVTGFKEYFP